MVLTQDQKLYVFRAYRYVKHHKLRPAGQRLSHKEVVCKMLEITSYQLDAVASEAKRNGGHIPLTKPVRDYSHRTLEQKEEIKEQLERHCDNINSLPNVEYRYVMSSSFTQSP